MGRGSVGTRPRPVERSRIVALDEFEPIDDGPLARIRVCSEDDCQEQAVVQNPYTGAFKPLCFRHAFIAALEEDPQAQRLALGWATAEGLKDANITRRKV